MDTLGVSWYISNFNFKVNYPFNSTLKINEVSYILFSPQILNTTNQYIERREGQKMDGWPWNPEEQGKMYSFHDCLFSNGCLAKSSNSYTVVTHITHWGEPVLFYSTDSLYCFTSLLCLKSVVDTDEKIFLKNKNMKTREALEALQSNPRKSYNI